MRYIVETRYGFWLVDTLGLAALLRGVLGGIIREVRHAL